MNKHQLDRLFEEKLTTVQQEPSDKAKARFDQLLAQKHRKPVWIWWRVAAAVLLLGISTVTYLRWWPGQDEGLTADLPGIAEEQLATHTDPGVEASRPESLPENDERSTATSQMPVATPASPAPRVNERLAEATAKKVEKEPDTPTADKDEMANAIAVADHNVRDQVRVNTGTTDTLSDEGDDTDIALPSAVAVALNEPKNGETPQKKRLPVTIIYKSSGADPGLIAMQDIRDDVDSLSDERTNSLKSILQNAGSGSLLAEFKKAKEDLFNLDIPMKTKKVEN